MNDDTFKFVTPRGCEVTHKEDGLGEEITLETSLELKILDDRDGQLERPQLREWTKYQSRKRRS